ncbi:MAG: homoserine dehydrogenase [Planctomycetes bacterium]|nr:homoserine dehydrogenase [Planctomycetota bacterium]
MRVGIIGLGTVGGGVVKLLLRRSLEYQTLLGKPLEIVKVCSKDDPSHAEKLGLKKGIFTQDIGELMRLEPDILVEVVGGTFFFNEIRETLARGASVVTANKSMLAQKGTELMGGPGGERLYYEASCLGCIPVISVFEEGVRANRISAIRGIFNGTCNYILSEMANRGLSFGEALASAQKLGYAEADPTFDVEGIDASHKLSILASLAIGQRVPFDLVKIEGIRNVEPRDFAWAKAHDYSIKMLSMAEHHEDDGLFVGTFPAMVNRAHPLAHVGGSRNAISIFGDASGEIMLYGAGAGEMPTASAIVSDILSAAQGKTRLWSHRVFSGTNNFTSVNERRRFPFYVRFTTVDQTGTLVKLCEEFSSRNISLSQVHQDGSGEGRADLIFITHPNEYGLLKESVEAMAAKGLVISEPIILRILEA